MGFDWILLKDAFKSNFWVFFFQAILPVFMVVIMGLVTIYDKHKTDLESKENQTKINEMHTILTTKDTEINDLKTKISSLENKTEPTKIKVSNCSELQLNDGKYQFLIDIEPIGNNDIPEFKSIYRTSDGVKILGIEFVGKDLPITSERDDSKIDTQIIIYRNFPPRKFRIIVTTEKITHLNFDIPNILFNK